MIILLQISQCKISPFVAEFSSKFHIRNMSKRLQSAVFEAIKVFLLNTAYYVLHRAFLTNIAAMQCSSIAMANPSVRLSVTNVLCAQTAIATGVINGLSERLFHLVLGKLSLDDGGHP